MYPKQEAAAIRKQFWISFGQYLAPIPSADGNKINWINYKTGIRFINFKMDVTKDIAYIGIELSNKDAELRNSFFNHFKTMKAELESELQEEWQWEESVYVDGRQTSRIYQVLGNVNVYDRSTWPGIISFLKDRMVSLDRFWLLHKDIFEMLS